jgi:hypothetical protein
MTATQGYKAIVRLFSESLAEHQFGLVDDGIFVRTVSDDVSQRLAFPGRAAPNKSFWFTIYVGVRFGSLERLLRPDGDGPTIVMPIHLLRPDTHFTEWQLSDANDAKLVQKEVLANITRYALPFLGENSSIAAVKARLANGPRDWYVLSPDARLTVLIAIEFIEGRHTEAMQELDTLIDERRGALPKHRLPFVSLRKRMQDELHAVEPSSRANSHQPRR